MSVEDQGPRWGHLFGSTVTSSQEGRESRRKAQSRAPSGWLRLDSSVFTRVAQTISAGSEKRLQNQSIPPPAQQPALPNSATHDTSAAATPVSPYVVRALCNHEATEMGHLSFHRGDILRVLRRSDPDTVLCSRGSAYGLVPIVYITLAGTEDSLYQSGTVGQALTQDHSGYEV